MPFYQFWLMNLTKPILIALFFLCFNIFKTYSSNIPDSLLHKIESIENESDKLDLSVNLMRKNAFNNSKLAHSIADYSIQWTANAENKNFLGKAYHEKAILFLMHNNFESGRPFIKKAIKEYEQAKNDRLIGYCYRSLGVSYFYSNNLDSSINAHFKALNHLDSSLQDHKLYYALTCEELAKVFYESSNNKSSKEYALKAHKFYKELNEELRIIDIYTQLVLNTEDFDSSKVYLDKIIEYSILNNDSVRLINAYANYGNKLIKEGDFQKAKKYSKSAFNWFQKYNQTQLLKVGVNLGNIYIHETKFDSARNYLEYIIPKAIELEQNYVLENAYANLKIVEQNTGNLAKALDYADKNKEFALKNMGIERDRIIKSHELELELENKNKKLNVIHLQNELLESKSRYQIFILSVLSLGMLIMLFLLLLIWQSRKKLKLKNNQLFESNKIIQHQKESLEQLLENNKKLFSIIGHDLRGPIANIFTAFELIPNQEDRISEDTEQIIALTKNSLQSVTDLLENLLAWSKTQRNDYTFKISEVSIQKEINEILNLYKLFENTKKIHFDANEITDVKILTDSFGFRTILRNLISNSIKFSDDNSSIFFSLKKNNKQVDLIIEDEAGGLPEEQANFLNDANLEHYPIQSLSNGLGLKLVKSMVYSCNAKIKYTKSERGSLFIISFNCA